MIGVVVGIRKIDYDSKKTGKPVHLVELHVTSKDNRVAGIAVSVVCTSPDKAENVVVGEEYLFMYDKQGDGAARLDMILPSSALSRPVVDKK